MAIKSVTLDALPKRTHEFTADEKADAAAIVKAVTGPNAGKFATDGEVHKDTVKDGKNIEGRALANAAASRVKRMLIALNVVPEGQVVVTSTRGSVADGFTWYMTFAKAPAEPRKRNRAPKTETPVETPATA